MTLSIHEAVVPAWLQILGSVARLLDKAEAHCAETGEAPAAIVEARLAPDMLPFAYQVKSTVVHSLGAIEGARRGGFSPDRTPPPDDFAGLKARVEEGRAGLAAIDPAELDALAGGEVVFSAGSVRVPFTVPNFLLSFSNPNFHFHATATYALLRAHGLAIGKMDYLGQVRSEAAA